MPTFDTEPDPLNFEPIHAQFVAYIKDKRDSSKGTLQLANRFRRFFSEFLVQSTLTQDIRSWPKDVFTRYVAWHRRTRPMAFSNNDQLDSHWRSFFIYVLSFHSARFDGVVLPKSGRNYKRGLRLSEAGVIIPSQPAGFGRIPRYNFKFKSRNDQVLLPQLLSAARLQWADDVGSFLEHCRKRKKRMMPNTIKSYRQMLSQFTRWAFEEEGLNIRTENVDLALLEEYLNHELINNKLQPATVELKAHCLRAFFRYLTEKRGLLSNPTEGLNSPGVSAPDPQPLETSEIDQLIAVHNPNDYNERVTAIVLEIQYSGGARAAEALGIRRNDVFVKPGDNNSYVRVLGKGQKHREIPLSAEASVRLRLHMQVHPGELHDHVFLDKHQVKPFDRGTFYRTFKTLRKRCGNVSVKRPHQFRASFATHLLDAGADSKSVSDLLGHESLESLRFYDRTSLKRKLKVHRTFHPRKKQP
jgi:integrase/recombinase XerC